MERIQELKNTIESILDEIDEGLIEIETICLTQTILDDENDNFIND
jgi:hypothetical protein